MDKLIQQVQTMGTALSRLQRLNGAIYPSQIRNSPLVDHNFQIHSHPPSLRSTQSHRRADKTQFKGSYGVNHNLRPV